MTIYSAVRAQRAVSTRHRISMLLTLATVVCAVGTASPRHTRGASASTGIVSWATSHVEGAGAARTTTIETNAPVLRWNSTIVQGSPGLGATAVIALSVKLARCPTVSCVCRCAWWSTYELIQDSFCHSQRAVGCGGDARRNMCVYNLLREWQGL